MYFKNFFNKFILINRGEKILVFNPRYRKKDLDFWNKKLKETE